MYLPKIAYISTLLEMRTGAIIAAPATNGIWNDKFHDGIFKSGVDHHFANLTFSESVLSAQGQIYDFSDASEVRGFAKLIPGDPRFFFKGSDQALQIIEANPLLKKEITGRDLKVYVPFFDPSGALHIASVFHNGGWLHAHLGDFHRGIVPKKKKVAFVIPVQVSN